MTVWVATAGRTLTRPDPSWDWWALVGVGVTLVLFGVWLRRSPRPWMVAMSLPGGLAFSAAVDRFGVVLVLGAIALVFLRSLTRRAPAM